jgi:signal transduction histidine kinase
MIKYFKQFYIMSNSKPVDITSYGKNANFKLVDPSTLIAENNNIADKNLLLRLHELEDINFQLEKMVEDQTAKLANVVATNAKFISILAHDLRSPFQTIIGALDNLEENYKEMNGADTELYIHMASNSVNTTLRLLENLLSWTSLQSTGKDFNPVKVNIGEVISTEIVNADALATQKQISINLFISADLFATADLQMIKTILRNLINNAIKYSYLGGEITIRAIEKGKFIEIEISDHGVGISKNTLKELFHRSELHSTRGTGNEYGTGLGLLLCKEFISKHGGTLKMESETGKGTKVAFKLPHYI